MPTYEYMCAECGHEFEARRPMKYSGLARECERCGGWAHKQFPSRVHIQTWDSNPLKRMAERDGYDASSMRATERDMLNQGVVLTDERDRTVTEHSRANRMRKRDKEVERLQAEYRKLPKSAVEYDVKKAWAADKAATDKVGKAAELVA